jgi:hypothetical protein
VFEVTATTVPMNGETRVLTFKSLDELRRAADKVAREADEERIPDVPEAETDPEPELDPDPEEEVVAPSKSLDELRHAASQVAREVEEEALPDVTTLPVPEPEPEPIVAEVEPAVPAKSLTELRRAAAKAAREVEEEAIPDVPEPEPEPPPVVVEVPVPSKSLSEITAEAAKVILEEERKALPEVPPAPAPTDPLLKAIAEFDPADKTAQDAVKALNGLQLNDGAVFHARILSAEELMLSKQQQQVDAADKESQARSVDPLRRHADAVALEFATEGVPRKAKKVEQPAPVPDLDVKELKRRMRHEILIHLSGDHE